MELNDLLTKAGIDPKGVIVMRHCPTERELRKVLPWLAAERPETYNAYQQSQRPAVEKAMQRSDYLASFIGHEAGKAMFIGLYRRGEFHPLSWEQYWQVPPNIEMRAFGMRGFVKSERDTALWFDLRLIRFYKEWKGRLVVDWPSIPVRAGVYRQPSWELPRSPPQLQIAVVEQDEQHGVARRTTFIIPRR